MPLAAWESCYPVGTIRYREYLYKVGGGTRVGAERISSMWWVAEGGAIAVVVA